MVSGKSPLCRNSSNVVSSLQFKIGDLPILKTTLVVLVLVFVGCQGQTFQYSRGWTNGKRSGYPASNNVPPSGNVAQLFEVDNGLAAVEDSQVPSGTLRLSLNGPQGRLRSLDYAQYLSRKLGNAGNRKPVWVLGGAEENSSNGEF